MDTYYNYSHVSQQGLPDFCFLEKVDEVEVLNNLQLRFQKEHIYTYIGDQVVSVNPFQKKPGIYSAETLKSYQNMYIYEVSPHIYALAQDTYKKLLLSKESQCVIISGESGSGKTEASKIFLEYISKVSTISSGGQTNTRPEIIMKHIIESNIVLEAFGNAKTLKNDNSSRFGKFIELEFDGAGVPISGKIQQFLLEKSRVHTRAIGERSFHIFYQFLTCKKITQKYGMSEDPAQYRYLKESLCYTAGPNINDQRDFKLVEQALESLKWTEENLDSLWRMLSAILLIGNIEFQADAEKVNVDAVQIQNPEVLKKVASLLHCNSLVLEKALISRSLTTGAGKRQSSIKVLLNPTQARETRDSFAKVLYDRLFSFVVEKINETIGNGIDQKQIESIIGILDIYGFEVYDQNNSFEQFIINYANEKLQQLFINLVLRQEQEEYIKEGIEWKNIDNYFDNQPIIDLIEGQPVGLLRLLDEACIVGQSGTPENLIQKFNQFFSKHKHYESYESTNNLAIDATSFMLKHYAGSVTYNLNEFIHKNKDPLYQDLINTLESSSDRLLLKIFQKDFQKNQVKKIPTTAGFQFKLAINALVGRLNACQPHYIRCIKSNDEKKAGYFDYERVKHQIRYLNTVETVRVRKAGFANKQHYSRFFNRYKLLSPATFPTWTLSAREGVMEIVKHCKIEQPNQPQECHFGKKKLFIKSAKTLFKFEELRAVELPRVVVTIQKVWRGYAQRKWFKQELTRLREEKEEIQRQMHRKKCALIIADAYIRYKVRVYIKKIQPWLTGPYYNKGRPLPTLWTNRTPFDDQMQIYHIQWWAKVKVTPLSIEQRALIRQKILALDLFGMGYFRKKEWDCKRKFQADYLSDDSNPKKQQFSDAVQLLFQKYGDKEILFADNVIKINKRGKSQLRTIIITDQHIYKYDPKKYTQKKTGLKVHSIVALSTSNKRDTFLAIHFKPPVRDLFIDLGCDSVEKVSEVSTNLVQQVYKLTSATIPLLFREPLTFNNSRDSRNSGIDFVISFSQYPKGKEQRLSSFVKGKGNTAIVYYPEKD
ncbi:myosin IF [Tieghemostelium lacteum]|uniref:Myosin IF n=1 Tax=Tieghemostelium lacteum TaxID=361077 RepID=A0A151ZIE2_TIELA|nr:myosin IF [Tieghemostelium lacteum]|eukprot:KYQ93669.1 myosin IF [Tieghemostelium lacteum]